MNFQVGDEVECIKDCGWKGMRDYLRVGDRAIIKSQDYKGNLAVFDIEIIFGWHKGEIAPMSASNAHLYFKKVQPHVNKYKINTRLIAHEDFRLDGTGFKRGDVAVIKQQVDDLFQLHLTNTDVKFSAFTSQLDRHFDIEQPNPCPPSLRKWLSDVQTKRS